MSDNIIILQPKYVADFQCDGSKCNAKCCGNKWRIGIDVDTYKKYQRIKNPALCYAKIICAMFNVIYNTCKGYPRIAKNIGKYQF